MVSILDGARHNDPSLCDPAKGEGFAKRDELSILRRFVSSLSLWAITKGEREEDSSLLFLHPR